MILLLWATHVVMTGSAFESQTWVSFFENWFGENFDWTIVRDKKKFTRTTANPGTDWEGLALKKLTLTHC